MDAECFLHDRAIFPAPKEDTKGNIMWQSSLAQELLREDIKAGRHKDMKPKVLYETKAAYNENYELDFFRSRIYQEVKWFKHRQHMEAKNAKKANNKDKDANDDTNDN